MTSPSRSYPGSRWWRFDVHTHTPASKKDWDGPDGLTPEAWLLRFMIAELDAVVITDHNSGAWVDRLKEAYAGMARAAELGEGQPGFRELKLFPGVEISAQGGVHILAVLDESASTSDVDSLLGSVGYQGTKGDTDGVTTKGLAEVIQLILDARGIPIPAHVDKPAGLLQCSEGRQSRVQAATLLQALAVEGLLAVEWCDPAVQAPEVATKAAARLARVLGSDSHGHPTHHVPGSRYTWVKMAWPSLEGLRLALLDGNGFSLRCSDEGAFDPSHLPAHTLAAIEIANTRYMGNGRPARVELSPFFNAIIGGRGTGKSTVVHALRLAAGRGAELEETPHPRDQFEAFRKIAKVRTGDGALKDATEFKVEWRHEDALLRLTWSGGGASTVVEELRDGAWHPTTSQAVNADRFPVRILSQGQIADMAGDGRRALLTIIDQAAGVAPHRAALDEATRAFKALRAKLRELEGKLRELPEVERKLGEVVQKLEALARNDHAAILRAYALASRQRREIDATLDQAGQAAARIEALAGDLEVDDWSGQHTAEGDPDLLAWRANVDTAMEDVRRRLQAEAEALRATVAAWRRDERLKAWETRRTAAAEAHASLQDHLAASGVHDPGAFQRLTGERQVLEQQAKDLARVEADRVALVGEIAQQTQLIAQRRSAVTATRVAFLAEVLHANPHVRIAVVPYGFDARRIERELRELVDANEDRFASDILTSEGNEDRGLAHDLAVAGDKVAAIELLRGRLLDGDGAFNGHFRNHLAKRNKEPEFADRVLSWFPEDDLRIEYQRDGRWVPIEQASQGQLSAALLAFLLAFGDEPLVLDQPEDDLDNHLIFDLIVRQIRENKLRRQLIVVTHNPNVVVNGDAELVHVMAFGNGQCFVKQSGALQEGKVREEVCEVMEGGQLAFSRRWKRLGGAG